MDRYHFTFDTKYRAENFTDTDPNTDSDTDTDPNTDSYTDTDSDTDTNAYRYMVAIISHLLLYEYIDKAFKW